MTVSRLALAGISVVLSGGRSAAIERETAVISAQARRGRCACFIADGRG
jgi:hypothetical protein